MLLAFGMTLLGAIASYSFKVLNGETFSWRTLFLQLFVSIFAGLTMVMIALHYDWPSEVMGGVCGMAGWSGSIADQGIGTPISIKRQEETMKISDDGMALIKRFEGLRLQAYQDSVGVWTIGYG